MVTGYLGPDDMFTTLLVKPILLLQQLLSVATVDPAIAGFLTKVKHKGGPFLTMLRACSKDM